jgi:sulfide:quinone oxidoreductase
MARILIVGGGIGGTAAAYEIREQLGSGHEILLVGDSPSFSFTPSNPWVAVGWREPKEVLVDLADPLGARGIAFSAAGVETILPAENRVVLRDGKSEPYDYLVITTGPKLAFNEVPGLGPEGLTHSICTTPHAQKAWEAYQEFLKNPGPIVVGTAPGVSCFGPAYEFALILDSDLRKRKLRHKVPMTSAASAIPRASWKASCASGTSSGSPTPRSLRSRRTFCMRTSSMQTAPPSSRMTCPSPSAW